MPGDTFKLCIGDNCVELASVTKSGGGTINPPTHLWAESLRINVDIATILTASNPTTDARITGLTFVAQELGRLAESVLEKFPEQAKALFDARANTIKQIVALTHR